MEGAVTYQKKKKEQRKEKQWKVHCEAGGPEIRHCAEQLPLFIKTAPLFVQK